ncbi:MAG: hypothetical protein ACP5UM_13300 [Anaerolineae bacterium]
MREPSPDASAARRRVVLAATHRDEEGRWVPVAERRLPLLAERYACMVVLCARDTVPAAVDQLRDAGVQVAVDSGPSGPGRMGHARRQVLQMALEAGAEHIHFCDLDRALHWVAWYPAELAQVLREVQEYDFLVLGRTPEAFASHPPDQTLTESLANTVFNLATGLGWDIAAASRGLSARAARYLLDHSREATFGTDAEWPILLRHAGTFRIGYRECDGLGFETADAYPDEVAAAGGRDAWRLQRSQDPAVWVRRLELATAIARAAVETRKRLEAERSGAKSR